MSRPAGADPRIHIWGTLEARLQSVDLLILGGLDEGVWPAETRTDPWLSRAMRTEIGLPPPERRIGLAAHDFAEAFAAPRVILTRAEKRGGAPTVASRWLQRLGALAGEDAVLPHARPRRRLCRARPRHRPRRPAGPCRSPRPAPKPPVRAAAAAASRSPRSRRWSATPTRSTPSTSSACEPLDPLGMAPDYALRGTLIHDALGDFGAEWTGPYDAAAPSAPARDRPRGARRDRRLPRHPCRLVDPLRGDRALDRRLGGGARRRRSPSAMPRSAASWSSPRPAGPFTLRGRADRIDLRRDGRVEISTSRPARRRRRDRCCSASRRSWRSRRRWCGRGAFGEAFAGRSLARLVWIALGTVERGEPDPQRGRGRR